MSFFWSFSERGKGSTGIQKFLGSFVFPYFDPLLDIKFGEEQGVDHVPIVLRPKALRPFCLNIEQIFKFFGL